jgi:act minimal PKS acyl carrier protein
MASFTIPQLITILKQAAGEVEIGDRDVATSSYLDLGYDSLALLEVSARLRQCYGVDVPESVLTTANTPQDTVAALNGLLPQAVTT